MVYVWFVTSPGVYSNRIFCAAKEFIYKNRFVIILINIEIMI